MQYGTRGSCSQCWSTDAVEQEDSATHRWSEGLGSLGTIVPRDANIHMARAPWERSKLSFHSPDLDAFSCPSMTMRSAHPAKVADDIKGATLVGGFASNVTGGPSSLTTTRCPRGWMSRIWSTSQKLCNAEPARNDVPCPMQMDAVS